MGFFARNVTRNVVFILLLGTILGLGFAYWSMYLQPKGEIQGVKETPSVFLGPEIVSRSKLFISNKLRAFAVPTNKIFSGILATGQIAGLHTLPYSLKTQSGRLRVSVPNQIVSPNAIENDPNSAFLEIYSPEKPIDKVVVEDYSDLTVNLSFWNKENKLFETQNIQGSPYIFFRQVSSVIKVNGVGNSLKNNIFSSNSKKIEVFSTKQGKQFENSLDMENGFTLGFYVAPKDRVEIAKYWQNIVEKITTTFEQKDQTYITNYQSNIPTILASLPHQTSVEPLFTTSSIRGEMAFKATNDQGNISFASPVFNPVPSLKISPQPPTSTLYKQLTKDAEDLIQSPPYSYRGGKKLARTAQLLEIATNIGHPAKTKIQSILYKDLTDWLDYSGDTDKKYFSYDKSLNGLIANGPEFGSEKFNDHHFHYGYFIYAAARLGQNDPNFITKYGDRVNQVIKDVASIEKTNSFPKVRTYDWYEGHSWAAGLPESSKGNNQESTSEAINCWYSVWLWSQLTQNLKLGELSKYLYSSEINTANVYWLGRGEAGFPKEFTSQRVAILQGSKVEYSTFFSKNPLAIDGIEYLPLTSGSLYLNNPTAIAKDRSRLSYTPSTTDFWKDINNMYFGITDPAILAQTQLPSLPIDSGNSKSNYLYWLQYWQEQPK